MKRILNRIKEELLYCGLDKESYDLNKAAFQESNKKVELGLLSLFVIAFGVLSISAATDPFFVGRNMIFSICPAGSALCLIMLVILLKNKTGSVSNPIVILIGIFLYSYGLIMALLLNTEDPIVSLYVFFCTFPAMFITRPIYLFAENIATIITYLALCDILKPDPRFHNDKIGIFLYSIIGLLIGRLNMRQKVRNVDNARLLKIQSEDAKQARIEADSANKAKGQFLANMSHEIRTPINAVLGMDTMILRKSMDKETLKYARDIQGAGRSLLSIINDILDFSKIESGKMELVPVEYDFSSLVNDVINMINPKIHEKGLELEVDIDDSIPCRCFGDDVRIRQILVNLLTNAIKYTPNGKVTLVIKRNNPEIDVLSKDEDISLLFAVKDTGIGIKPEDISKLTEEFVRIEESRNRNIEGTGLGINIVVSLLNMMNSHLEVNSVYGEGSEFYFVIAQKVIDDRPIGNINDRLGREAEEAYGYIPKFTIPDGCLLVVDDNAMNRTVFRSLLGELECRIDEADSGQQCLELVKETKYDIVFLDHMMPDMDGIETLHHMKEFGDYLNSDTPVVILTANAISGAREAYLAEGFDAYLSKPIDADKLEEMIGNLIPDDKKQAAASVNLSEDDTAKSTELPFIDGVDWNVALFNLKSEPLLMEMVKNFSVMAPEDIKILRKMYDGLCSGGVDFAEFRVKVHAMKTNAATIGAGAVSSLAKFLEYAARDTDIETINKLFSIFEKEWNNLIAEVNGAFGFSSGNTPGDDSPKKSIDNGELTDYLSTLAKAMVDADLDSADAIIEKLCEYGYPGEQQELLDELKVHVLNIDEDSCIEAIEKWKSIVI